MSWELLKSIVRMGTVNVTAMEHVIVKKMLRVPNAIPAKMVPLDLAKKVPKDVLSVSVLEEAINALIRVITGTKFGFKKELKATNLSAWIP